MKKIEYFDRSRHFHRSIRAMRIKNIFIKETHHSGVSMINVLKNVYKYK